MIREAGSPATGKEKKQDFSYSQREDVSPERELHGLAACCRIIFEDSFASEEEPPAEPPEAPRTGE